MRRRKLQNIFRSNDSGRSRPTNPAHIPASSEVPVQLNTFSIAARCPRTGTLGVAVTTAVPAVGAICPYVAPGLGAASTQAWVNPYLAVAALDRLRAGDAAPDALAAVIADDAASAVRQIGLVDAAGRAASFTGVDCTPWCGHLTGDGYAIQGNMLTGSDVLAEMERAFGAAASEELAERMILALEAGQAVGGDKRGKQSAAVIVFGREDYAEVDLRVDDHPVPVAELRRVWGIFKLQTRPFLEGMARKGQPARPAPDTVVEMLLRSPPERPGGGGSA
jgi:uncharacterized Ntn-hydrolase superfamily protein